ncbi:pancreatic lipase-related protein 2-like isoform X2 [Homarus americanus]|uniref:pancreatic lipase-related protein 2-like isoform X2 n=1 Tax=Homarus americanus TaxID=6706 RepID=UPI001C44733B|nr:pancreatic lipase-related protein 2-like isoform X2 [Homarus americanus]
MYLHAIEISTLALILGVTAVGSQVIGSEERCYGELGCLVLDGQWWHPWRRPINLWPYDPAVINTTFTLHTRPAPSHQQYQLKKREVVLLHPEDHLSLALSPLDATKPTKVIIHSYHENLNTPWVEELTEALLQYGDYNVIVVNWAGGSSTYYLQAVANARLVGLELTHLLLTLQHTINLPPHSLHLIGYALGAHIAGYAGERVAELGRITGLSPPALFFEELPPVVRLDERDAAFVDVIHTNINGHGISQRCGTVDFYPNGGEEQPGCGRHTTENRDMFRVDLTNVMSQQSCSRMRALDLFLTSLTCPACFLGHECTDKYLYAYGMCYVCGEPNNHCGYLGIRAQEFLVQRRERLALYIFTSDTHPYHVYSYRVWFNLAHPVGAEDSVEGQLTVTLKGDNTTVTTTLPGTPVWLNHGQPRGWVVGLEEDVGAVVEVVVAWEYQGSSCRNNEECNTSLYIQTIKVTPIDYLPERDREANTRLVCGGIDNTEVISGGSVRLIPKDTCQEWSV